MSTQAQHEGQPVLAGYAALLASLLPGQPSLRCPRPRTALLPREAWPAQRCIPAQPLLGGDAADASSGGAALWASWCPSLTAGLSPDWSSSCSFSRLPSLCDGRVSQQCSAEPDTAWPMLHAAAVLHLHPLLSESETRLRAATMTGAAETSADSRAASSPVLPLAAASSPSSRASSRCDAGSLSPVSARVSDSSSSSSPSAPPDVSGARTDSCSGEDSGGHESSDDDIQDAEADAVEAARGQTGRGRSSPRGRSAAARRSARQLEDGDGAAPVMSERMTLQELAHRRLPWAAFQFNWQRFTRRRSAHSTERSRRQWLANRRSIVNWKVRKGFDSIEAAYADYITNFEPRLHWRLEPDAHCTAADDALGLTESATMHDIAVVRLSWSGFQRHWLKFTHKSSPARTAISARRWTLNRQDVRSWRRRRGLETQEAAYDDLTERHRRGDAEVEQRPADA